MTMPLNAVIPMVVENDGRVERSFDIYSRLLRDRIIMVVGEVNEQMASSIISQLLYLASIDKKADITMHIMSPGGSVNAGFGIHDTMQYIAPDVVTIGMGHAYSMGSFLLAAGAKNKRYALKNTRVMIHQPSYGVGRDSVTDIDLLHRESVALKELLTQYYADYTGKSYETMYGLMERDHWMSSQKALELGIVDRVITSCEEIG